MFMGGACETIMLAVADAQMVACVWPYSKIHHMPSPVVRLWRRGDELLPLLMFFLFILLVWWSAQSLVTGTFKSYTI